MPHGSRSTLLHNSTQILCGKHCSASKTTNQETPYNIDLESKSSSLVYMDLYTQLPRALESTTLSSTVMLSFLMSAAEDFSSPFLFVSLIRFLGQDKCELSREVQFAKVKYSCMLSWFEVLASKLSS